MHSAPAPSFRKLAGVAAEKTRSPAGAPFLSFSPSSSSSFSSLLLPCSYTFWAFILTPGLAFFGLGIIGNDLPVFISLSFSSEPCLSMRQRGSSRSSSPLKLFICPVYACMRALSLSLSRERLPRIVVLKNTDFSNNLFTVFLAIIIYFETLPCQE